MTLTRSEQSELSILLVEDEPSFSAAVVELLSVHHEVTVANSLAQARGHLSRNSYSVALIDKQLPDGNGLTLIPEIKADHPGTVVLVLTGDRAFGEVKRAISVGADDSVVKSGSIVPELLVRIPATTARLARERHLLHLEELVKHQFRHEIIGKSASILSMREQILRLRGSQSTVLITGESGTGKELVARRISALDGHRKFVDVNCAAVPGQLFESELFGHRKGSFTDARTDRIGKFELADDGDLFLDEIGELPLPDQAKLLRVLQEREFCRVGDNISRKVRCRVIVATNQNLFELVRQRRFREDLFHRLAVHVIQVPALRDRKEDITDLVDFFLMHFSASDLKLSSHAFSALRRYDWPGNIRELRNAIERGVIAAKFKKSGTIELEHLGILEKEETATSSALRLSKHLPEASADVSQEHYRAFLEAADKEYMRLSFLLFDRKATHLGEALGVARSTVFHKLSTLGVHSRPPTGLRTEPRGSTQVADQPGRPIA